MNCFVGIDPGTRFIGYGVIEFNDGSADLIKSGSYKVLSKKRVEQLKESFQFFDSLLKEFSPVRLVVESSFFGKNIKTLLRLSEIKAMVLLSASLNNIESVEVTPREVKLTLTGNGNATKSQVAYMVSRLMHCSLEDNLDASDALAIALCSAIRDGIYRVY